MCSVTPKKLFLIDGLGVLISAFLLGIILVRFESFFGIPARALYILAVIPVAFAVYDLYAYYRVHKNAANWLKGIAFLNLLYCAISIGFAIFHHQQIKTVGWLYLSIEIFVVICLVIFELKVARKEIRN